MNRIIYITNLILLFGLVGMANADIHPEAGPLGTTVTISGGNFGAFQSTQSNRVDFNGASALVQQWEDDFIMVKVPMKAKTGEVTVTNGNSKVSVGSFSVQNIEITKVEPPVAEAGSTLIIYGKNFGNTAGSRDQNTMFGVNQVLVNGIRAQVQKWRSNKIEIAIPANSGSGKVEVRLASSDPLPDGSCCAPVDYIVSNAIPLTVVPSISLQPDHGPLGSKVVLSGQDFGSSRPEDGAVLIGGERAGIAEWSNRTIVVHVPLNAKSGPVVLTSQGQTREVGHFQLEKSEITSMMPEHGPIGTLITIKGKHFGILSEGGSTAYAFDFETGANGVDVGGVPAIIHRWLDNQIDVWVPFSAKSGEVVVKRGGAIPKADGTCCVTEKVVKYVAGEFHVVQPHVTSYSPTSAGLDEVVTIKGSGFGKYLRFNAESTKLSMHHHGHNWENYRLGSDISRSEVLLNGLGTQVISWTDEEIKVRVPRRQAFGVTNPEGIDFSLLKGELIVKRGSWDLLENGKCCTPKKWVSALAGPFTILKRGLPNEETFKLERSPD
ncbi:MAG: IPT/TIG domain-containing protein [Nitrospirales bacterium]|nr:IPT/TIG domain-containing protein [Nitrospira sp.]MDR4502843.1 IPT/TIG domain-containing protein [Nitrospirales bacterium]